MFATFRRSWTWCALTDNALVRRVDRIEATAVLLAFVVTLLAVPYAVGLRDDVRDQQAHRLAAQAATQHRVDAVAVGPSSVQRDRYSSTLFVHVSWVANDAAHDKVIQVGAPVKSGQGVAIWVDDRGELTAPPRSSTGAVSDGIVAAVGAWSMMAALCVGAVVALRRTLNAARYRAWDRGLRLLLDNDDGWATRNS